MARIVFSSGMVQLPLGGINQWILAWLLGFRSLGHEVFIVEKCGTWPQPCYDVPKREMTDDCSYGLGVVSGLLECNGLGENWCFVDAKGGYHGLDKGRIGEVFRTADLLVDLEGFDWNEEAADIPLRVFVDGEPGWTQILMEKERRLDKEWNAHHRYYSVGLNIGTERCRVTDAGKTWGRLMPPTWIEHFPYQRPAADAPYTTVMNWKFHKNLELDGKLYGQKELEFPKFMDLPRKARAPIGVAVSGPDVPKQQLKDAGWRLTSAADVALSVGSYRDYILGSRGEFSVAKNVFMETRCGWIGEREGYYMASGRPVVVQDSGFSDVLPVGEGVFGVTDVDQAAAAIDAIESDFERHSQAACEIANEYFAAPKVLGRFLDELGL
jgi:hypothetical protein